jgi:DNA-binding NtrC family response regulator
MEKENVNNELIYILDDDQVFSHALKLWLEAKQYRVSTFSNAYALTRRLKYCKPDIVILDFSLSDTDNENTANGMHVAEYINMAFADLPIVMLSGQKNLQLAVDSFSNKIVDYVVKDNDFHEHLRMILRDIKEMKSIKKESDIIKMQLKVRFKNVGMALGAVLLLWMIVMQYM